MFPMVRASISLVKFIMCLMLRDITTNPKLRIINLNWIDIFYIMRNIIYNEFNFDGNGPIFCSLTQRKLSINE